MGESTQISLLTGGISEMQIANSTIKRALTNVYFLWGRGKTTIANRLHEKYGFYIYSTDLARDMLMPLANSEDQPYMCRDFVREYGVKSFWELPNEVIAEREDHFLREMTPMILVDLIALSKLHEVIICEGDIDYGAAAPIASHAVHLHHCGRKFDWFKRPDHSGLFDEVKSRTDLNDDEKRALIQKAYDAVSAEECGLPQWVLDWKVTNIDWDDDTGIDRTLADVERCFGF